MPGLVTPTPVAAFAGQLPDPTDRASYGVRGRALWAWETLTLAPGINLLASQTQENAVFAQQMAAQAASAANYLGLWVDQTGAVLAGRSVYHSDVFWVLLQDLADITAEEPGVSIVWAQFDEASTAENTSFDDATADIEGEVGSPVTNVQEAIEALVTLLGGKVTRTSATGSILLPVGTTAQRDGPPVAGMTRWNTELNGGKGGIEAFNGVAWEALGWVTGATLTPSGASFDLTGIPAWVNEIKIPLRGLSTNGASNIIFQLGTAVGFEATGYDSGSNSVTSTSGFVLFVNSAGTTHTGVVTLQRGPGNSWDYTYQGMNVGGSAISAAGHKTLTGELTRIRLTTSGGTNTFDAGTVRIDWRK